MAGLPPNRSFNGVAPKEEVTPNEEMTPDVCQPKIKEGSPTQKELSEIAMQIPKQWKNLGRILLSNSSRVDMIDEDESRVSEKSFKMLEEWKRTKGSAATYSDLYHALRDERVSRKDLTEKYCEEKQVPSPEL